MSLLDYFTFTRYAFEDDEDGVTYELPMFVYRKDWALIALEDGTGWRIVQLHDGAPMLPYTFNSAPEAARWAAMLNGLNVEWANMGGREMLRVAQILFPLYTAEYVDYRAVQAA